MLKIYLQNKLQLRKISRFSALCITFAILLLDSRRVMAGTEISPGDTSWMMTSTLLVLLMTIPGLALFYGGMVRKKNVLSLVMQCFSITCLVSVLWMIAGYSLAFTDGGSLNSYIGGINKLFLNNLTIDSANGSIPETTFMTFQMTFAIITPALICGAFTDRLKFGAMLLFVGIWVMLVYVPVTHWVWGGGFLGNDGVLDFAGGTVVHINAGVAGLIAAIVLGKRKGYGVENMAPHNLVLSVIGASFLWIGWFGFNAGSALAANKSAGMAMVATQISAAAAGLSWLLVETIKRGKPSVLGIISGAIGGLVAITPAAGFVNPTGALIIGIVSGIGCYWGATGLKHYFGYDDSLDVFGVHGVGGIIGAILTGVFSIETIGGTPGMLEGNFRQVFVQLEGIFVTVIYCAAVTFLILKIIDITTGLRVEEDSEITGLDLSLHGESVQ